MEFPRLKKKYIDEIAPGLMEKLQYKSVMQVPKIKKIAINQGLGAARLPLWPHLLNQSFTFQLVNNLGDV